MQAPGDEVHDPSEDKLVYDGNTNDRRPFGPRPQNQPQNGGELAQKIEAADNQLPGDLVQPIGQRSGQDAERVGEHEQRSDAESASHS